MMWSNRIPSHLPYAKGPYVPGCYDVLTEYSGNGLFMRFYYPTDAKDIEANYTRWIPWVADDSYIHGFSKVTMILASIIRLVFWLKSGHIHIPVLYGEKVRSSGKLRCIIFSHGLGGNRFVSSTICLELASRGYLVVALEHRDESASNTYYYKSKEDARNDIRTVIEHKRVMLGKNHYPIRNKQVHKRADECGEALDFLINLHNGNVPYNVLQDVPQDQAINFKLEDFVGRLDIENITASGHSFGGAAALFSLSKRKEFKQGIVLDPWMFPLKNEQVLDTLTQPLLFINTQTFHLEPNVNFMAKFLEQDHYREMYTISHTTHESQTDTVFVIGSWFNWFMKKLEPTIAMDINNSLILKFLKKHTEHAEQIHDCETVLKEQDVNISFGLTRPWA